MKYIKEFEININNPEVGDYAIFKTSFLSEKMNIFSSNTIGKIVKFLDKNLIQSTTIIVKYENCDIPNNLIHHFSYNDIFGYHKYYILCEVILFSKNKSEVEEYLEEKKYNL